MCEIYGFELKDSDKDRFWSKVSIGEQSECWEWKGTKHRLGYGQFKIGGKNGKTVPSHRIAKAFSCESFDESKHCLHKCDNRSCCNPNHIWLGTHKENMQDAALKNRTKSKRIGNGHRKIQKEQYQDIKKMFSSGMNKSQIARFFGVTPANIRKILNGESHG